MKVLGLTGSIATGKSTALKAFASMGIPVFSSDEAVHALYQSGEAVDRVGTLFPQSIHNGVVDRSVLARELIAYPERLPDLEAAIHPLVRERIADFIRDARSAGADLAVADIPLLFESNHDYGLDAVAVTAVDDETLRRRALARPGMSVEKLETILARQLPQAEKQRRANYVIDTSGSLDNTARQIAEIVADLRKR